RAQPSCPVPGRTSAPSRRDLFAEPDLSDRLAADLELLDLPELLGQVGVIQARIGAAQPRHDPHPIRLLQPSRRPPSAIAMHEALDTPLSISRLQSAELPDAQ